MRRTDRETSTALVSDYRCGLVFLYAKKDMQTCMTTVGGDLMGHCDDVRMDGGDKELRNYLAENI